MKILLVTIVLFTITYGTPVQDFAQGNRLFTADIYKVILTPTSPFQTLVFQEYKKQEKSNFLISPFSAEVVLGLTHSGAKDATAQELRTSLHFPNNDQAIRSGIRSYFDSLEPRDSNQYQFHSANKIYVKENLPIKAEFKQIATTDYQAEVENIDFSQKTEAANTINQWVEKQTKNKIRNLMDEKSLGDDVAAVLINTLYFQGRWLFDFSKEDTKKADFFKSGTDAVKVDTMFKNHKFYSYFESAELNAKFLELPFQGRDASFVVVLPNEKDGLAALEEKSEKVFASHDFKHELVNLALPKFKIESKADFKKILLEVIGNKFEKYMFWRVFVARGV